MPCNLAVSITKAAVTNETLLRLLTPELIEPVLRAYLEQQYQQVSLRRRGNALIGSVAGCFISVHNGTVRVIDDDGDTDLVTRLSEELSQLLTTLADRAFEQAVAAALVTLSPNVQEVTVAGADQQPLHAAVFSVKL